MPSTVVTVKQLNLYIKSLLEGNDRLAYISISGEISNFKRHFASGHLYFTLKDDSAALKCVMFKGNASRLRFSPEDGMKVICSGKISVFERDGVYQLYAENMTPDGEGDLMLALERIKEKLSKEGLFSPERKKAIPSFPKKVGVITSETGAAVRDIFNVLSRRYPLCDIVFCPATVQGPLAPPTLCSALDEMEKSGVDVIIIGRGGGSIEDLWCFNDETLARRIADCSIPVISAVGHETDFTICDFVADLRAPTPSAAAELAVPDATELVNKLSVLDTVIKARIEDILNAKEKSLDALMKMRVFSSPIESFCQRRALLLDAITDRINNKLDVLVSQKEKQFCIAASKLDALSPVKTMLRGFTVAQKDGKGVKTVKNLEAGDKIRVRFHDGSAECTVDNTTEE